MCPSFAQSAACTTSLGRPSDDEREQETAQLALALNIWCSPGSTKLDFHELVQGFSAGGAVSGHDNVGS